LAADPPVLLMDEPFSAVDPVVRTQLQDELIRLQAELGKTIVFVTHDIDEAVKLGDRIAVFAVGGRLAQYAEPSEVLSRPADDFVADFVGRDRGYRALSFIASGEMPLHPEPTLPLGQRVPPGAGSAAEGIGDAHGRWLLVVDERNQPRGWLDCLTVPVGHQVGVDDLVLGGSLAGPESSLRTALDAALSSPSGRGVAVDGDGIVIGTVAARDVLDAIEKSRGTDTLDDMTTGAAGPLSKAGART
jgi:osmoprotectant transport system ATP-binding protein